MMPSSLFPVLSSTIVAFAGAVVAVTAVAADVADGSDAAADQAAAGAQVLLLL